MKHFLKKLVAFIFISSFSCFVIGFFIEQLIEKNLAHNQYQIQEDWHVKHQDVNEILFVGNSRTWRLVNTEKITQLLGQKSYALCQDGRDSRILYHKLKTYLLRNKSPKQIFLQFDPYFINPLNFNTFYGKQNYLGYIFNDRLGINYLFKDEIGFNKYEEYIPLKRYFSINNGPSILYSHLANKTIENKTFKYGSESKKINWENGTDFSISESITINLKFNYIDSILELCKVKLIKINFIYPPQSYPSYQKVEKSALLKLDSFAKSRNINYWNFNSIKYNNVKLFYNHLHLNDKGSNIYTIDLFDSITSLYKKDKKIL
jgi:hypothetical protein